MLLYCSFESRETSAERELVAGDKKCSRRNESSLFAAAADSAYLDRRRGAPRVPPPLPLSVHSEGTITASKQQQVYQYHAEVAPSWTNNYNTMSTATATSFFGSTTASDVGAGAGPPEPEGRGRTRRRSLSWHCRQETARPPVLDSTANSSLFGSDTLDGSDGSSSTSNGNDIARRRPYCSCESIALAAGGASRRRSSSHTAGARREGKAGPQGRGRRRGGSARRGGQGAVRGESIDAEELFRRKNNVRGIPVCLLCLLLSVPFILSSYLWSGWLYVAHLLFCVKQLAPTRMTPKAPACLNVGLILHYRARGNLSGGEVERDLREVGRELRPERGQTGVPRAEGAARGGAEVRPQAPAGRGGIPEVGTEPRAPPGLFFWFWCWPRCCPRRRRRVRCWSCPRHEIDVPRAGVLRFPPSPAVAEKWRAGGMGGRRGGGNNGELQTRWRRRRR